jgi:hypothetical protein
LTLFSMSANLPAMLRFSLGICIVGLGLLSASAAQAVEPLVAVTESPANVAPRALRLEIRPTVETALKNLGLTVVPTTKLTGDLSKCEAQACIRQIGVTTGATHVLVVTASFVDEGFTMHLQVFDAKTGQRIDGESRSCVVCIHDDLLKALHDWTPTLWLRVQSEEATSSPAPAASPALALAGDVATSPAPASLVRRTIGPTLVVVGAAAAVVGVVYMAKNGARATNNAGCGDGLPCPFTRRNLAWSAPLVVVGALTAALGGYLWWTTPSGTAVTASVGPDGLYAMMGGRF